MATTAETIAARLEGEGSCFADREPGETLDEICATGGCCRVRPGRGVVRYAFSDGSAIVLRQGAWTSRSPARLMPATAWSVPRKGGMPRTAST